MRGMGSAQPNEEETARNGSVGGGQDLCFVHSELLRILRNSAKGALGSMKP